MALVNYNRSLLANTRNSSSIPVTSTPQRVLEFGLFVENPVNFVELLTTIGWRATRTSFVPSGENATLLIEVRLDGVTVGSTTQEAVAEERQNMIDMSTTFQTVLTNVTAGHRVFQVFVSNTLPSRGTITLTGPANISGKVIRNNVTE